MRMAESYHGHGGVAFAVDEGASGPQPARHGSPRSAECTSESGDRRVQDDAGEARRAQASIRDGGNTAARVARLIRAAGLDRRSTTPEPYQLHDYPPERR